MEGCDWLKVSPHWSSNDGHKGRLLQESPAPVADLKLDEIIKASGKFPRQFPIDSVRCHYLQNKNVSTELLEFNINSAYPVIHEWALYLYSIFLSHQRKFAGNYSKFYENLTLLQFIDRLLSKRAVAFLSYLDTYLLLDGTRGSGGWETVGTSDEKPPLILENCLSYDEIKLAALLSVSSHTVFINDGNRYNCGKFVEQKKGIIQNGGVIIGLIGARLEKPNVMEFREILKTKEQNCHHYGYGEFFLPTLQGQFMNFYGDSSATYDEISLKFADDSRFVHLGNQKYFDKLMFERRIALSIDTLLIEANDRAKKQNTNAFIHVVGIGLGVWKVCEAQDEIFMDTFAGRLEFHKNLTNISDICFAHIKYKMAGQYKDGDAINGICLHFENRHPHTKLGEIHKDKLLVVSYAWDGNALPGNEFWLGNLSASGDPAAACSTQIAELHNFHINTKIRACNLRVATVNGDLVTFQQYQEMHKND